MSEALIQVEHLSKKFCRSLKRSLWYGLQDLGNELRGKRHGGDGELRKEEFWAVKDVSFELKRGECLGLIGHNGAGKTTLLRMLNGLIKPDQGRVEMRGRVGALIALGAGFNPILTGRENIYVNASVLGLSKQEVDEKIGGIVDFAEIGDFVDTPVQNYSSGMQVRLGFAVATALEPDILLLDEVLAVGDIRFQAKCYSRIADIKKTSAVIFVSHSMTSVTRMSDRVLIMGNDNATSFSSVQEGIQSYYRMATKNSVENKNRYEGSREITIDNIYIETSIVNIGINGIKKTNLDAFIELKSNIDEDNLVVDFVFRGLDGNAVAEFPSTLFFEKISIKKSEKIKVMFKLDSLPFAAGTYMLSIFVFDSTCTKHYHASINIKEIEVLNDQRFTSPIQLQAKWGVE